VQANTLRQRTQSVARQGALDPGDGLGLWGAMKEQFTVYLEPDLMKALTEYAERRRKPKSLVAEVSPDASERQEAALVRRLDRITRQINRLERDVEISVETIALFIRYWLTAIPSLPEHTQAAARAKGGERYEGFMQALGRRLAKGPGFIKEVTLDVRPPGFSKSEIGEDTA
jgi:hypothetical protein